MQSNPQSNPVFWNGFQIQVQSTKRNAIRILQSCNHNPTDACTYLTTDQPIYSKRNPLPTPTREEEKLIRGIRSPGLRHIILTRYPLGYRGSAGGGAADGMSKDYSDVTRMSVTNPNQFRLRMLWRRCARPVQRYAAPVTAGGRRTGVTPAAICPGTLRDPGTGRHRSHSGLRDGTGPVTLRDSETGWHRSHSWTPGRDGTGHTPDPWTGRARSHSGTPGRDGTGHTPGLRDGTAPVTLRDPGTGRHRSHSGTPGRDGTGHTPGLRDGTPPVTLRDPGTGRHRSHSGTPGRDGTGHTPGLRDGTGPVTLRDSGTGRARSHSGTPGRDGPGHTPGLRDGMAPVTLRDSETGRHRSHSGIP